MIRFLKSLFAKTTQIDIWEYGVCHDRRARRSLASGEVQFILWPAEHPKSGGKDFWHRFGIGHEIDFVSDAELI